jgi:hypothetical protein
MVPDRPEDFAVFKVENFFIELYNVVKHKNTVLLFFTDTGIQCSCTYLKKMATKLLPNGVSRDDFQFRSAIDS